MSVTPVMGSGTASALDNLTGLPGRAAFYAGLETALAAGRRVGLMLIDIDGFGDFNSALGRPVGDQLLAALAARLPGELGAGATVARIDGDEFAAMVPDVDGARLRELGTIACALVRQPCDGLATGLAVTASVGSAAAPDDGEDARALWHSADLAQFSAKSSGRDRAVSANPTIRAQINRRIRDCVGDGNFSLSYQPILELPGRAVAGFECLLRWNHPTRGLMFPGGFRPVLEDATAAMLIGNEVVRRAVQQARRWGDAGLAFGRLAINVSAAQLRDPGFGAGLSGLLRETRVRGDRLALEVPQDITLGVADSVVADSLASARAEGLRIALDGWALGDGGLALPKLPIDELKLDRAFVQAPDGEQALRALVAGAHLAGLAVTAEGVETAEQLERVERLGFERAQGWHLGRPMPAAKAAAFAAARPMAVAA